MTKENKMVDVKLSYSKGLDRYYGLLDLAEKYGIIKKVSTRYELPDGTKVFGKTINVLELVATVFMVGRPLQFLRHPSFLKGLNLPPLPFL